MPRPILSFRVAIVLALTFGSAAAQPGAVPQRGANYQGNQFNLPAYSPPLTPYPPAHTIQQQGQPTAPRMHPQPVPPAFGYSALPAGWFCPPLNAYYPAVPQCPVQWVHIAPNGVIR